MSLVYAVLQQLQISSQYCTESVSQALSNASHACLQIYLAAGDNYTSGCHEDIRGFNRTYVAR